MDKMTSFLLLCTLALSSLLYSPLTSSLQAQSFSGQLIALPTIEINGDGTLNWRSYSDGNLTEIESRFGNVGDHLALAAYDGDGLDLGVINPYGEWTISSESRDSAFSFQHGDKESVFLAGGDFNGNTLADAAYATNFCSANRSKFKVLLDPINSTTDLVSIRAGKGYYFKTFLDADGNGSDDLCYAKPIKSNGQATTRFKLVCRDAVTNLKVGTVNLGKIYSTPLRLKNATGADYIVNIKQTKTFTKIKLLTATGSKILNKKINAVGNIVIGDFLELGYEQILLVTEDGSGINIDTTTGEDTVIMSLDGIVLDATNINHFSDDTTSKCFCDSRQLRKNGDCNSQGQNSTDNSNNNSGGDNSSSNPDVGSTQSFGSNGSLWKPTSDTTRPSFQGNPVVLFSGQFQRQFESCSVPLKNGGRHELTCVKDQFSQIPFTCFTNPLADGLARQTWRFTVPCNQVEKVEVKCVDSNQTVIFTVPQSQQGQVCSRFG